MTHDPVAELAGHIAALPHLPPADRAARARSLIDEAKAVLSSAGDEAIYQLTRTCSFDEAATTLGVSSSAINKAVSRYNARRKSLDSAP